MNKRNPTPSSPAPAAPRDRRTPEPSAEPRPTFWTSSNADQIQFTAASGATFSATRFDNSTGPKEAIKVWGLLGLGTKAADIVGDLGEQAIDTAQ